MDGGKMKTQRLSYLFALIAASISVVNSLLFGNKSTLISLIVVFLVSGIVTFLLIQLLLLRPMQKSIDRIVSEVNKNNDLIAYAPMNHLKNYFFNAIGGAGYLLKDKFVFHPHKLNFSTKGLTYLLSEIEQIQPCKMFFFDTGLKIRLKSGKEEKFVIDRQSSLFKKLIEINNH
jgi:hypothetical protein